ncbi:MAG TPA: nucleotide sugar dehydrogenase, partial [Chitinophagaceae bacterium]|nr:nucleotide sugar dehydrogenase [Chitinophagaceae bacterium]
EPGVKDILVSAYSDNKLVVTEDFSFIKNSDAIIIAIALLIDQQKKILDTPFLEVVKKIAPFVANQTAIIIETSVPVGFNRNTVLPVFESEGKLHGKDFLLAHSPERIKSGTMLKQLLQIPKVIGGISKEATEKVYEIYQWFFDKELLHQLDDIEAAEMLKLAGMLYRDVNIALSNQLAQFANTSGINFVDLISLINTDKEANLLQPGIGVGGHCTPVYPYFLIENFKKTGLDFTLARQSRIINDQMADYAVSLVRDKVKNKKALLLGLSFRSNVKEDALSTTYLLNGVLLKAGFEVRVHDVEFSANEIKEKGFNAAEEIYGNDCEVVFLVTMHKEYNPIDFERLANDGVKFFVDGRNKMDRQKIEKAGIQYIGIGH